LQCRDFLPGTSHIHHRDKPGGVSLLLLLLIFCCFSLPATAETADGGVSAAELDEAIESVIARPEYAWRLPRERPSIEMEEPDRLDGFWDKLGEWLGKAGTAIGRWLERVGDWLEKRLEKWKRPGREATPSDFAWPVRIQSLLFVLLAAAASVLAILLFRIWKRRRNALKATATAMAATPDILDEGVRADALPSDRWMDMAREFLARGELRPAIRAMFLACLAHLALHERLGVAAFKSNRQYMQELDRRAHDRPDLLAAFGDNVTCVERVWYGTHVPAADDVARFEENRKTIFDEAPHDRGGEDVSRNGRGIVAGIVLVAAIALFATGIVHLFALRFRSGDIYPPYSSLRSDPLGTRILYEALSECRDTAVSRNMEPMERIGYEADYTLLYLGVPQPMDFHVSRDRAAFVGRTIRHGARIVVTFLPRNWTPAEDEEEDDDEDSVAEDGEAADDKSDGEGAEPEEEQEGDEEDDDDEEPDLLSLGELWDVSVTDDPITPPAVAMLSSDMTNACLPASISCHTSLVFSNSPAWRTVYARNNQPVVIEREMGKGSVVLSTLSYFASNEAMRRERHPELLAWMIGSHREVIFDEYQRGLFKRRGIAVLAREYRLHWFGAALLLLVALFLWRNGAGLVPAGAGWRAADPRTVAEGKDSAAGLVNLLRRNISPGDVLSTCVEQWRRSAEPATPEDAAKLKELQELAEEARRLPPTRRDFAKYYNRMCEAVRKRKGELQ